MTEKTLNPIWVLQANEGEARAFWEVDDRAGMLAADTCGGGYPPKSPLPLLIWLRVFRDAKFHISAEKVGAARAYQTNLMQEDPRKRLIFSGISRNAKDPKKYRFNEVMSIDARKLIPFKRSWIVEFQKVRKDRQLLDGRPSQISHGQLKLVEEALCELSHIRKKKLWRQTPDLQLDNKKTSIFCSTYNTNSLTKLVSETVGHIRRSPLTKGVKSPEKSVVRKALSMLVSFRPQSRSFEANSEI